MGRRWLPTRGPRASGEHEGGRTCSGSRTPPPPWPAMVIVHGAGSRKENHADFARACAARGLGGARLRPARARGLGGRDVPGGARRRRPDGAASWPRRGRRRRRGSASAARAWAASWRSTPPRPREAIAGVIAICPAGEEHLRRGLRARRARDAGRATARAALEAWLAEHDLREAVELIGRQAAAPDPRRGRRADPVASGREELYARAARAAQADPAAGRPPPLRPARRGAPRRRAALARAQPLTRRGLAAGASCRAGRR